MSRVRTIAGLASCVLVLAACSSSVSSSATPSASSSPAVSAAAPASAPASPSAAATTSPSPAAASPSPAASSGATAVPTSIDPCQLVTSEEASKLGGVSFGAGKESSTPGNDKMCTYTSLASSVASFSVSVLQAPDVATAQAGKAQAEADLQKISSKLTVTQLPNLADGAAVIEGSLSIGGHTENVASIFALKGTTAFGFGEVIFDHPAPTSAALQAQAQIVLGRLP